MTNTRPESRPAEQTASPLAGRAGRRVNLAGSALALLLAWVTLALPATQATAAEPVRASLVNWQSVTIPHARQHDFDSAITRHRYRIFISVPKTPPPPPGYPVLYVLDGNAAFPLAAQISRNIERRQPITGIAPALVVGIGYAGDDDYHLTARSRDYTLAAGQYDPATEGGADRFLDFIEQELKPLLASAFAVDQKKQAVLGHSFGGLLVLHALFTRPDSFSTYLAASPSIWWQDKHLLTEMEAFLDGSAGRKRFPVVQITVGSAEDDPPRFRMTPEMLATRARRPMVAEARQLAETLNTQPAWAGRIAFHELPGENHGSAWQPALSRGFELFLE